MRDASSTPPLQPTVQTAFAAYSGPPLDTVRSIVASQFQVRDAFLDPNGIPTILVGSEPPKEKFKIVLDQLATHGVLAALRASADALVLKVFQKPQARKSRWRLNLGLFLATVATVSFSGYVLWTGWLIGDSSLQAQFDDLLAPGANPFIEAAAFTIGLLAIIGLNEFGHNAAANHHKMDSTLPLFITGPHPFGTFGARISLISAPPAVAVPIPTLF